MRIAAYTAILTAILLALTAATAFAQDESPRAFAYVQTSNDVIRVFGAYSRIAIGAGTADAPRLLTETRNEAGDAFASYRSAPLYHDHNDFCDQDTNPDGTGCSNLAALGNPDTFWRIRIRNPNVDIDAAEVRFGNQAGQWTPWRTLVSGTLDVNSFNFYHDLKSLGLAYSRYDAVPASAPGQSDVLEPPTDLIKDRLRGLPGGELTALFLVPMLVVAFVLPVIRSPAILLIIIAASMAITILLIDASPFAMVMPLVVGGCGTLVGMQFGFTRQFGKSGGGGGGP